MARIPSLNRTLSTTIPFARGVADRAITTARPILGAVVGRVATRLPRRYRTGSSTPETFAPSPTFDEPQVPAQAQPQAQPQVQPRVQPQVQAHAQEPPAQDAHTSGPSPATVARNTAGPRPTAKPAAKAKPRSVPGAKLPVTRPST